MKKIASLIIGFCLLLLLAVLITSPASAAEGSTPSQQSNESVDVQSYEDLTAETDGEEPGNDWTTEDFALRAVPGLNGYGKEGTQLPLTISLTSRNADFEGIMRVIVPTNSYGQNAKAYEKEIMLTAGEEKTVMMTVQNPSGLSDMRLELENASGKTVLSCDISMKNQSDEDALVGVLSDDFTALNYFDGLLLDFDTYQTTTQIIELDADTIPDTDSGLDALGYLIINSYDTSQLDADQIRAIEKWVENGGVLILGLGSDYRQTLSGFQDGFLTGNVSGMRSGQLFLTAGSSSVPFSAEDGILDISLEQGTVLNDVLDMPELIWMQSSGQGTAAVTAFNLGMEPVSSWDAKAQMAQQLLKRVTSAYSLERIEYLNYNTYYDNYTLPSALGSLREAVEPKIGIIAAAFVIFVILAGPGLYLILKKADRREWLWLMVPALSVVMTAGIFLFSRGMRITKVQETSITVCEYDAQTGVNASKVKMAFQVPGTNKQEVKLSGELSGLRLTEGEAGYSLIDTWAEQADTYSYTTALREQTEGAVLSIHNQSTFDSSYLSANAPAKESCGLDTSIVKTFSGISGTVTNTSTYDMRGVAVFTGNKMVILGDLKAGETAEFTEDDNEYFSMDYSGMPDIGQYYDLNDREMMRMCTRLQAIYEWVGTEYLNSSADTGVYTIGWIPEWDADYVTDDSAEEINTALAVRKDIASYENYPDAKAVSLYEYTQGSVQNWDTDGWMYASEVEVTFDLGSLMQDAYAFVRADDSDSIWGSTADVTVYGYNLETGAYDELFADSLQEEFTDGCPYMDETGKIRMKFISSKGEDETDYAPQITVIGGER